MLSPGQAFLPDLFCEPDDSRGALTMRSPIVQPLIDPFAPEHLVKLGCCRRLKRQLLIVGRIKQRRDGREMQFFRPDSSNGSLCRSPGTVWAG